ncbi:ABC transporter substrate-binding protein [Shewanella waksmanii]|uniref:ABC transporter substrate-binding protein n=1 Tax=Shewanella waksmanii TaxID=213783 RepID=UPI00373678D2
MWCIAGQGQASDAQRQVVPLYTYHYMPPYVVDSQKQIGLFYEVARFFNQQQQEYDFQVSYIPRKRLNYQLEQHEFDGLVIGVNPVWFQDREKKKYLWTAAFMLDQDEFLSHRSKPFEYQGKASLVDKQIGGISGFRYHTVDNLVAQGLATRIDTSNESRLLKMLLKKRFDCAIVSRATTIYYQTLLKTNQELYFSSKPHDIYTRHFLAPIEAPHLHQVVETLISQLVAMKNWQQLMHQYQTTLQVENP